MAANNFVLEAFNTDLTAQAEGTITKLAPPSLTSDATGVIEVQTQAMRDIFKFASDSIDINTVADATDVTYWLDSLPANYNLNFAHAMMDAPLSQNPIATNGIDANKNLVKHDFVRHIAFKAFGTHHGVDLFENEGEMTADIAEAGANLFSSTVLDLAAAGSNRTNSVDSNVLSIALANAGTLLAPLTNADNSSGNLSRQLMLQIAQLDPIRYSTLSDTSGAQSVPFVDGDTISCTLTLTPHVDQYANTSANGETAANTARIYKITLLCVSGDPQNTVPADSEPVDVAVLNDTYVRT
jgi:hypothetical protein